MPKSRPPEGAEPENGTPESSSPNRIPAVQGVYALLRKLVSESQVSDVDEAVKGLYLLGVESEDDPVLGIKEPLQDYMSTVLDVGSSVEPLDYGKLPRIQITLPHSVYFLLKYWATAEERNLAALAGEMLDRGIREMLRTNSIPDAAVEKYQKICKARLATAEVNAYLFGDSDAASLDSLYPDAEVPQ